MSAASKLFAAVSGTALLLAVAYAMSAQGSVPITLLVALASAAAVAVVVTTAVGGRDLAPAVPLDAPPPESRSITAGAPARPSMWPPVVAAGIGLVAVGAAVGMGWLVAGLVVALAGTAGWYGRTWREHPSWTPRVSERVQNRLVLPAGLFWAILLCVAVVAIAVSRILLAVPEKASVAVALGMAVILLVAFFVIASQSRTRRSVVATLVENKALALGGAGLASGLKGERSYDLVAPPPSAQLLVAHNTAFAQTQLN